MSVDAQKPDPPAVAASGEPSSGSVILKPVFIPAAAVIVGLIGLVLIFRKQAEDLTEVLNTAITDGVGWWYVIAVNFFLIFVLFCAFTRIGRIRLGRDDERPEFSVASWFMMLFSAGMGIGLVFFGVAEPLSNYVLPPEAHGNDPLSIGAAQDSVGLMMLQWGLHPWGIYAVVGLGIAYMTFRRGRPLAVRWLLEPLIGRKRVEGWMGHTIDTIAIIGTLFGIATSFGFGVSQIVAGLEYLGWAESSPLLVIGIITVVTAVALWSVLSGVHKGLKWLSNINMSIAALLALVVFLIGPTIFLLQAIPQNLGSYLSQLPVTTLHTGAWSSDGWEAVWTIGYWGWWTSWAPFVGMFIARISRGRTIREFVLGVLLAPTAASLVWFTIFGESAMLFAHDGRMDVSDGVDNTTSLFEFFGTFPIGGVLSVVGIIVVVFFFVTSSDSGSLVIDMLACGGKVETPKSTRVFWAVLEGVAAAVLLVVGGDVALTALQTVAVSTAAPFSVILVLACISLYRAFRHDVARMPEYIQLISTDPPSMVLTPGTEAAAEGVRTGERLSARLRREVRGLRGVSASLGGFEPDTPATGDAGDPAIVSYRPLNTGNLEFDSASGRPIGTQQGADPLDGEVFDTEEFQASQQYVDMGERPAAHGPATIDEKDVDPQA
ncbi:BCCT family transporter [Brevibacterium yomogidense]|uniref:BCCT family transporter n=1 Tax=Brevibacterium yomogidense TaxID=946573 RepID=UPI0018DF6097|nr:BCCT family transporter [Brevibacterium yomogidense]